MDDYETDDLPIRPCKPGISMDYNGPRLDLIIPQSYSFNWATDNSAYLTSAVLPSYSVR